MNVWEPQFPWVGFIFWFGLFSSLGFWVWSRFLTEQERQKTLRTFAERGSQLDKEMVEQVFTTVTLRKPPSGRPATGWGARALMVAGIVIVFIAVGLLIGAQVVGRMEPDALLGMSTAAAIVGSFGIGMIAAAVALRRMRAADKELETDAGNGGQ